MDSKSHKLHIYFLPMLAPGHSIPAISIAREFSRRGAKSTIITTPLNASRFSEAIDADREGGSDISISLIPFPCREAGLPDGCEDLSATTTTQMSLNFLHALDLLEKPVEHILQQGNPDCLIAGAMFHWSTALARRLNIPRIVFYGTGFFPMCVFRIVREHRPHDAAEEFEIPGLPDPIRVSRRQLPDHLRLREGEGHDPLVEVTRKVLEADEAGFGIIVNTFYELEPAYSQLYRKMIANRAWHIGPVSLSNIRVETEHDCINWLSSKKPNSVVYVCFGSMAIFQKAQLHEIAAALESSGQEFLWVVGKAEVDSLPEGFEARTEGRGMVVKGWAPQVRILEHEAVGGFVTHCGWNSMLEGIAAGVPMVTWPLSAEQFFNEKLATEILGTGVAVGAEEWTKRTEEMAGMGRERIERALLRLMVGEEGERIRCRARELGELARRAVQEGGSSHAEFNSLMEHIRMFPDSSSSNR